MRGVKFLEKKNVPFPNTRITSNSGSVLENSLRVNFVDLGQDTRKVMVLRKTNLNLKVNLDERVTLAFVISELIKMSGKLVTECGLYPCPKSYALLNVLKNRQPGSTVNSIMQKYWFPTHQIVSSDAKSVSIRVSLPPLAKEKEDKMVESMLKILKRIKPIVENRKSGCISYFNLQVNNILSMASLCYANAKL